MFGWDLNEILKSVLQYAASNPWQFIYYVLLGLSPLFLISAVLAWQLAKQIEHKEKDKKRKAKREANMAKARRHKTDWYPDQLQYYFGLLILHTSMLYSLIERPVIALVRLYYTNGATQALADKINIS